MPLDLMRYFGDTDDERDVNAALVRMILSVVLPWGSGIVNETISLAQTRAFANQMTKWQEMLEERLAGEIQEAPRLVVERLANDETFLTTLQNATQIAMRTNSKQEEKLSALAAAVSNSSRPNAPDDDLQLMFLNFVADLTQWHLRLLKFFDRPHAWTISIAGNTSNQVGDYQRSIVPFDTVMAEYPELFTRQTFYEQCVGDLVTRGLITLDANRIRHSPEQEPEEQQEPLTFRRLSRGPSPQVALTTWFGKEFLNFITDHAPAKKTNLSADVGNEQAETPTGG